MREILADIEDAFFILAEKYFFLLFFFRHKFDTGLCSTSSQKAEDNF